VILATAFLGSFWILLGVLIVMVALPTIYSYCLHRKQVKEETE
jgi:ABC-type polysaccharide/polyol phosphate export permease